VHHKLKRVAGLRDEIDTIKKHGPKRGVHRAEGKAKGHD
jgi:hypothetical protein